MTGVRSRRVAAALALLAVSSGCVSEQGIDVFPLYRDLEQDGRTEFSVLWPLSSFETTDDARTSWVFPFYLWSDRGERGSDLWTPMLLPAYISRTDPVGEQREVFPLYRYTRDGDQVEHRLLWLLAGWSRDRVADELTSMRLLGLFDWEGRGGRDRLRLVQAGPLLWDTLVALLTIDRGGLRYGAGEDERGLSIDVGTVLSGFVNLFHHDDFGSHSDTRLLTVFGQESLSLFQRRVPHEGAPGAVGEKTILFPLWWDMEDDRSKEFVLFPLWWNLERGGTHTRHLWPLYGQKDRGDETIKRWFVYPLLETADDDERGTSSVRVLLSLIGWEKWPRGRRSYFFPLYEEMSGEDGLAWSVILGMFGYRRTDEGSTLTLLWIPFDLD